MIDQVASLLAEERVGYNRMAAGAEPHQVIEHRGHKTGIEIKFSSVPKPSEGLSVVAAGPASTLPGVIPLVARRCPLARGVDMLPLGVLASTVAGLSPAA